METQDALREVAALRHNLHINSRLRLEFMASISKLLRDYGIRAEDQLLSSLILAVPDELSAKGDAPMPPVSPQDEPMPPVAPMPPESPMPPVAPMPPEAPSDPDLPMPPVAPE